MSKDKNEKIVIQEKLKELIKLAKEIGTLSEKYVKENDEYVMYMIFTENSDEMNMLNRFAETYEINE